ATWPGDGDADAVAEATGSLVEVVDDGGDPATAALTLPAGGQVVWSEAEIDARDAQLTTFIHAGLARRRARALAPELAWLARPQRATVNIDQTCNAFSDGDAVYFFRAGDGCESTGRLPDIIYHEVGHSLHRQSMIEGAGAYDPPLGEGLADYFAAAITGDPAIAPGFFGTGEPLRHIDPDGGEAMWPEDISDDPHATGLIVAGALWDLRRALVAELGDPAGAEHADQLAHAVMQRASDIPSAYVEVLAADDDDGDLANGTPHACAIHTAFAAHGLADPQLTGQVGSPQS